MEVPDTGPVVKEVVLEPKPQYMLRNIDGTPLSSYIQTETTNKKAISFTPKFDELLKNGTVVALEGALGNTQYYEIVEPMRGQDYPNSIYGKLVPKEKVEKARVTPVMPVPPSLDSIQAL